MALRLSLVKVIASGTATCMVLLPKTTPSSTSSTSTSPLAMAVRMPSVSMDAMVSSDTRQLVPSGSSAAFPVSLTPTALMASVVPGVRYP